MKPTIIATDKDHLRELIKQEMRTHGKECDLNHIDISNVKDMFGLFNYLNFNGDISKWNTSHVISMAHMFGNSTFNGDISNWNVSNVTDMSFMFCKAKFNRKISNWDVSSVTNMAGMFGVSNFDRDISNWDVSKVENMGGIFTASKFTKDLSNWKPLSLKHFTDTLYFTDCKAPEPYWAKATSHEHLVSVINNYLLKKELDVTLTTNNKSKVKPKI